jgi:hypothetical protein
MTDLLIEHDMVSKNLADLVRAGFRPRTGAHRRGGQAGIARVAANSTNDRQPVPATFQMTGTLDRVPRELPRIDEHGAARLRQLDERLAVIGRTFPGMESDIQLCRLSCAMVEGIWQARVHETRTTSSARCACPLCSRLPVPPRRGPSDYRWRKSEGVPLAVKVWPYRSELDNVLTGGWLWTRTLNDHTFGLDLRKRYEDDILVFHEYKRVVTAIDIEQTTRSIKERLGSSTGRFDTNGARALISGLFISHKRSVDEYWIRRHLAGTVRMPQSIPIDVPTYSLLQLFDSLLWHYSPDAERWRAEILAALVLCRVLDDMTDARADSIAGEISSIWLTSVPTHDKTLLGAAAIAAVKYSCMPEAHGHVWDSWVMPSTAAWLGLTGRHALWFDGITDGLPPAGDCPLCGIQPEACAGLLFGGVTLRTGPQPATRDLSPAANLLSERCRVEYPQAWSLFHAELAAFEGLHGRWQGNVDNIWTILRRTYIAAVIASLNGGAEDVAREIQSDSGAVGAEQFHRLVQLPTGTEDTALLGYMFGCAHPHFLWNCIGYQNGTVSGDWLDG